MREEEAGWMNEAGESAADRFRCVLRCWHDFTVSQFLLLREDFNPVNLPEVGVPHTFISSLEHFHSHEHEMLPLKTAEFLKGDVYLETQPVCLLLHSHFGIGTSDFWLRSSLPGLGPDFWKRWWTVGRKAGEKTAASGIKEERRRREWRFCLSQCWHNLKHHPRTHTDSNISIFTGTLTSLHLFLKAWKSWIPLKLLRRLNVSNMIYINLL